MRTLLVASLLLATVLAGCSSSPDTPATDGAPTDATPGVQDVPESISGMELLNTTGSGPTLGIWVESGLAYLSGGAGLRILDVHDPAHTMTLATDVPDSASRDVDLIHHPNGRTYAVLADSGESWMKLYDVTEPTAPQFVSHTTTCVHTVAVVPGTTVVYGAWSLCHAFVPGQPLQGDMAVVDFADPEHPAESLLAFPPVALTAAGPKAVTATSCHEITFNAVLQRAYCAAITDTQVWDVSDPLHPMIIAVVDDPLVNIHHSAWDARNGTVLILGDEFAGDEAPTPTCSSQVELPTSALAFYDISDLAAPRRVSHYNIPYDAVSPDGGIPPYCSTHLGDVIDGHDLIVMGWYTAGTVLVDFSDLEDPTTVATWRAAGETNVWETRYVDGHVYSSDTVRGLDVLGLT